MIVGVTGQDGAYLAEYLLGLGYDVHGTTRDSFACETIRLERLNIKQKIHIHSMAPTDFRSVLQVINLVRPHEIYNLSGKTSVSLSFEQPVECMSSIADSTLNILEAIRYLNIKTRFFSAGSSESFGDTQSSIVNENSPFKPVSPYALAKCTSYWQVATYRKAYGLFACTGILGNHESPLRPDRFVTKKIVNSVKAIASGRAKSLKLGNIYTTRDWGWAPDYVAAMHAMLQAENPEDFIIATGASSSLHDFVRLAFKHVNLKSEDYLQIDNQLLRPTDIGTCRLDPTLIKERLGWTCNKSLQDIVSLLMVAS